MRLPSDIAVNIANNKIKVQKKKKPTLEQTRAGVNDDDRLTMTIPMWHKRNSI